ncbi:putative lipid II flippase FtsW [Hwanghaeella grinnelliae]|uniref:Probable peptidoglycan glycosyltransferase FtsW n=1 Tax=Hwanghaeella grinnelliae TaxID=2500179 RepID=A0A437QJD5_9PROT|nr:putative lipid II flippase FtsW [Hwanghaeella grinnelliae]RVU34614.1 putative lipid II flippase FtsW [Hwanghaeella grinnelliae]
MMHFARNDTSILGNWWWTVDRWLLGAVVLLGALGLLLTTTASPPVAERINVDSFHFVKKQAFMLAPALFTIIGVSLLNLKQIRRLALVVFVGALVLMVAAILFGTEIKGATRWISLGGLTIQPSEFAKPAFAVLAGWILAARRMGEDVPGYAISAALCVLVVGLLALQPDIGQAFVVCSIWFTQLFIAGLSMSFVIFAVLGGLAALVAAYYIFPHVATRIDRFLDPQAHDSYQIDKAMEAFQSGGIMGRGPGEGIVKQSLPDGHADFIFAVAGEEFGLFACMFIVAIFVFVVVRGLSRLLQDNDMFVVLAATGLIVQFALQALVNMASTLSLIPTKGMTLPFISYGGSSLLALALGMGMLLALTRRRPEIASWRD